MLRDKAGSRSSSCPSTDTGYGVWDTPEPVVWVVEAEAWVEEVAAEEAAEPAVEEVRAAVAVEWALAAVAAAERLPMCHGPAEPH
jgi:hypothetical protein